MKTDEKMGPVQPWWHFRIAWLAVGAPALVVVAGCATLVLAIHGRDTPVPEVVTAETHATPAMKGRNHAADRAP